jgi:hypothetical protein
MLLLERFQYRALRISMGLMGSTPDNSLGVLSGIPSLRYRFFYLNFRYLVNTFQKNGHPLRDRLEKLSDLSPQKCLIPFHQVSGLDIQPEVGYTRHQLGVASFAVHHSIDCNIGLRMRGPASVFTAELAAIRMAMDRIENEALGRYLILTDSMGSIRAMWNHEKSRCIPIRLCTSVNKNVGN